MTTPAELLARFLRQRAELGSGPLVLERLSAEQALAGIRRELPLLRAPGSDTGRGKAKVGAAGRPDRSAHSGLGSPGEPAARSGAGPAGPDAGPLPREHDALRDLCLGCTLCRLAEGRTQVVFSDGNPSARVMVVGEAPGANEDATGRPFVGAAGKLLDLLLAAVDLSRKDSVYICNVLKCRPPGNRNPRPDEIETCSPYLRAQIRAVRPEVILAVGTFAGQLLTGEGAPLGKLRGQVHAYEGTPMVVTYHPAALLRNSGWTRATWDDLQLLRHVLDEL